jgi:hypothetical protein
MIEQSRLDFDAPMPGAAHEDAPGGDAETFPVGCPVYLRGCAFGLPGRVLRQERGKLAVLWADLGPSYIGRHSPASLMLAEVPAMEVSR